MIKKISCTLKCWYRFCSDLTVEKIPNCDLILVKDFLLHLSFDDTDRFLKNLSNTFTNIS